MFAVGELLNGALQRGLRVPIQIAFHIPCETLSQHFGAPPQVLLQAAIQHQNLVIGSAERYQRDANNQRDDQSSA